MWRQWKLMFRQLLIPEVPPSMLLKHVLMMFVMIVGITTLNNHPALLIGVAARGSLVRHAVKIRTGWVVAVALWDHPLVRVLLGSFAHTHTFVNRFLFQM